MTRCQHCNAETTNGLALCDLCQQYASSCFEFLPVYFRNLARWRRPSRPNGSLGTSGQWLIQRGESEGSRIATALERVANDLDTWARALTEDRSIRPDEGDTETETVAALCSFLDLHLTSIATLEWAGEMLREIGRHERTLRQLTEAAVPGWYAGACRQVTGRDMEGNVYHCEAPTYVVPGLTWVTCVRCGATTYARDHLDVILDEARGWVAPPMRLAEAIVALVDTELSVPRLHKRISKWGERDRIVVLRASEYGPKRYRLGEVLDVLFAEGATRLDDTSAPIASGTG